VIKVSGACTLSKSPYPFRTFGITLQESLRWPGVSSDVVGHGLDARVAPSPSIREAPSSISSRPSFLKRPPSGAMLMGGAWPRLWLVTQQVGPDQAVIRKDRLGSEARTDIRDAFEIEIACDEVGRTRGTSSTGCPLLGKG